ncbi:hypothetical protein WAX46_07565 [Bacillus sp. FJAT-53060]|uniref:hypothetical protein n=1 Tax=Bacillus sp. FJAT-53060 TaxID=3127666 RepID=UPI0030134182
MAGKWFSKEEKLNILSECDQGNYSVREIAEKYTIQQKRFGNGEYRKIFWVWRVWNVQSTISFIPRIKIQGREGLPIRTLLSKRNLKKISDFQ